MTAKNSGQIQPPQGFLSGPIITNIKKTEDVIEKNPDVYLLRKILKSTKPKPLFTYLFIFTAVTGWSGVLVVEQRLLPGPATHLSLGTRI